MQISHFNIYDQPDEREKKYCEQFGYVSMLMANKSTHSQAPLSYLNLIIAPAIYQENIKFYFNEDGNAVGYVVWAMLAADVERQVIKSGQFSLHESEWNEGDSLWIVDFLVPYGNIQYVLRDLRDNTFLNQHSVRYMRVKNNRRLIKEIVRNKNLSFFA